MVRRFHAYGEYRGEIKDAQQEGMTTAYALASIIMWVERIWLCLLKKTLKGSTIFHAIFLNLVRKGGISTIKEEDNVSFVIICVILLCLLSG
jgi:hypothetical protein